MSFLAEIKPRKVFRVAAVYAVVAWLLLQVITAIETPLNLPDWTDTLVIVLAITRLPLALVLSWEFDVTPGGIVRTENAPIDSNNVHVSLALRPSAREGRDNAIAVLPFENLRPHQDNAYFADALLIGF